MHRIALLLLPLVFLGPLSLASADPLTDPVGPVTAPDGRTFAVVVLRDRFDECSGAGGEHYIFDVEVAAASPPIKAHTGGHAIYLGLLPDGGLHRSATTEQWYVAEVVIAARLSEDRDGNPDSSVSGWCLDRVPRTQASVQRLVPVTDRHAGRKMLASLAKTGLPRAYATLAPTPKSKAAGTGALAIVRVVERVDRDATRFRVQAVDGSAPEIIDFGTLAVWSGDLVVVAVAGTRAKPVVTRALVADTLADAQRWKGAVAAGWPPDARVVGWAGAYAVVRWSAAGKVKRAPRRCGGNEVVLSTWSGSSFQIEPPRVAAPAGTRPKDIVTGVVVPQPADRCGRVARFVRAYATPGATRADWIVAGEPAASSPLVE